MVDTDLKGMRNLIDKLNTATAEYDKGTPIMSDKEWDDLYFKLVKLEQATGCVYNNSPTHSIHFEQVSELAKVEHNHPLLSLKKTKSIEEVEDFVGDKQYTVMSKMDGLTVSLKYENGELVSAETRGDGVVGEDILHNAYAIDNLPLTIGYKDELIVDGEVIITYNDFEEFKDDYANPRNLASGSIRLLDSKEAKKRHMSFVAWKVYKGFEGGEYYSSKLQAIQDVLGFTIVPMVISGERSHSIEEDVYFIKQKSQELGYPIDGCVIGIDNIAEAAAMGEATAHHEQYQLAYKFYDEEYETTLRGIKWSMGRTGVLTPVAIFDDIDFGDSVVNRASLHNLSIMKQLYPNNWHTGLKMNVFKANQIIPQVSKVWFEEGSCAQRVDCPICPICGEPTVIKQENDSKVLMCDNPNCLGKVNKRIEHYCSKKGLDIKGLSEKTIEKLIDWGWLNNIKDLYELKTYRSEWIKKQGFGVASVDKILAAIEESRNFNLTKFIAALGIREIGTTAAKVLSKRYKTWEQFRNATRDELIDLDGFGEVMVDCILSFDYNEADEMVEKYMIQPIVTFDTEPIEITAENGKLNIDVSAINGLNFVVTGKVTHWKNRGELSEAIEAAGGKVTGSVSKKTDYLINNDVNSETGKNKKAKELGIPIINEEELLKMLNN